MTKLAVVFFAALAINAALAGVTGHSKWDLSYDIDISRDVNLDKHLTQMRSLAHDLTKHLRESTLSNSDEHLIRIVMWQHEMLLHHVDRIVEKLEREDFVMADNVVLREVVEELREVLISLRNADVHDVHRLAHHIDINIVKIVETMEKLVRWVHLHVDATQGSLIYVINDIFVNLVTVIRNIDYQIRTLTMTQDVSIVRLGDKIHHVTKDLTEILKKSSRLNDMHVKIALRNVLYHLESMKMHLLDVHHHHHHHHEEVLAVLDSIHSNLHDVIVSIVRSTELTTRDVDDSHLRHRLVDALKDVSEHIMSVAKRVEHHGDDNVLLIANILKTYLFTIDHLRSELVGDVDTYTHTYGRSNMWELEHLNSGLEMSDDFDGQLPSILHKLLVRIESMSVDRHTVMLRSRELIHTIHRIIESIESRVNLSVEREVSLRLHRIVNELRRIVDTIERRLEDNDDIRHVLITGIRDTFMVLENIWSITKSHDVDRTTRVALYDILRNVVLTFQNHEIVSGDLTHKTHSVWQLISEIRTIVRDLRMRLVGRVEVNQHENLSVLKNEIHKAVYVVEDLVSKLRMLQLEGDVVYVHNVVRNLEVALMHVKRVMGYNVFVGNSNVVTELDRFLQIVVEQIEQLAKVNAMQIELVLRNVLENLLVTLKTIRYNTLTIHHSQMSGMRHLWNADSNDEAMSFDDNRYRHGLENMRFGEDNIELVVRQVLLWTDKVVRNMLTISHGSHNKHALIHHVRQLVQLIDNIVQRLHVEVHNDLHKDVIYEIVEKLTILKRDLFQYVYTGMISTDYQIVNQLSHTIRKLGDHLVQIWRLTKNVETIALKDIFVEYLHYLHSLYTTLNGSEMSARLLTTEDYHHDNLYQHVPQIRLFIRDLYNIVEKIQTRVYLVKQHDMTVVRRVLLHLHQLIQRFDEDSVSEHVVPEIVMEVREIIHEVRNWMSSVEMYGGEHEWHTLAREIIFDLERAVEKISLNRMEATHMLY